ncbi:MAG: ACP S-malonyltransferase [Thermoflavifilum sp.]|nr:ACP S-malonyltransferase [Thermoflavifilum sp.]MCL6513336.1 ACP S-malonyltransferase [Alicyclobacillus sp.]
MGGLKVALVFPGQGAQTVGMGRELAERYPAAREVFEIADEALGYPLSRLCWEGPEEELRLTYHTQPALLTAGIAALRALQSETSVDAVVTAGHSLGEYTALVASDALDLADAVRLVHRRGRWMDEAVPAGRGTMAAVMGMEREALAEVCEAACEGEDTVDLANLNCPGQIVISGTRSAVERAAELARSRGARRVVFLEVSGPFHSRLMRPAAARLAEALDQTELRRARWPVMANVDAQPKQQPEEIRQALAAQLYSPVRWEDDVRAMLALGVDTFIEFGPGTVLSGLIRKVDRQVRTLHVEDLASLQETRAALQDA